MTRVEIDNLVVFQQPTSTSDRISPTNIEDALIVEFEPKPDCAEKEKCSKCQIWVDPDNGGCGAFGCPYK